MKNETDKVRYTFLSVFGKFHRLVQQKGLTCKFHLSRKLCFFLMGLSHLTVDSGVILINLLLSAYLPQSHRNKILLLVYFFLLNRLTEDLVT